MRLAAWIAAICLVASPAVSQSVTSAGLIQPTGRYDHAILGDALEWGGMTIASQGGATIRITLPNTRVFEDIEARVADLDGDGRSEVLVVETDIQRGASLAVYDGKGKVTATPFIGRTHRWLAPAGIGDLDGDGLPEIAYVDRPHLARELVILTYRNRKLTEIARIKGLTNHRIGDSTISGGYRNCGGRGEIVLTNANWSEIIAVGLNGKTPAIRKLGSLKSAGELRRALTC